jgi:hypothetical protein
MGVVEYAALLEERLVDRLGVGEDLLQGQAEFADGAKCGYLAAARDIYKDSQHSDDGQADKQDK